MTKGWHHESHRHSLASRGIKTSLARKTPINDYQYKPHDLPRINPEYNYPFHTTPEEKLYISNLLEETGNTDIIPYIADGKKPKRTKLDYLRIVKDYHDPFERYYVTNDNIPGEFMIWVEDPEEIIEAMENISGYTEYPSGKYPYSETIDYDLANELEGGTSFRKSYEYRKLFGIQKTNQSQKQKYKSHEQRRVQEIRDRQKGKIKEQPKPKQPKPQPESPKQEPFPKEDVLDDDFWQEMEQKFKEEEWQEVE